MASYDQPEMVRELMWVERPSGLHLSQSSTPGGRSALALDDDNALVTQAVLFPADNALPAEGVVKVAAVVGAVGIAVGIIAVKARPHIKARFNDLKSKLNGKSEGTVEVAAQEDGAEQSDAVGAVRGEGVRA